MNRLYHYPLCPFSRKVRLVLAEKKIEVQLTEERFWEKSTEFLRRNPAGQVPILRLGDEILTESLPICEYLEDMYPEPALIPRSPAERYEMRRLIGWFDDKFNREVTSCLLGERLFRKVQGTGYPDSRALREGLAAAKFHLDYLATLLDQRRWLAGSSMTLADFTAAAHLSCLDYVSDVDWNRSAVVKDWYATIKSRPAFRSILTDQIPGFPQPKHYADLDF